MAQIQGVHHVALTVSDLARSADWYERVLGANKIADMELFAGHQITLFAVGPTLVGLHHDDRCPGGDRFDEFRCGLDHLAFGCASRAELEEWQKKLDEHGVEHSGITEAGYGNVLVFRDPDNIQLEFFASGG